MTSAASRPRYATIVADPPWDYEGGCVALGHGHGALRANQPLPYKSMALDEIKALPVSDLAATDARLFLWTTNRHLPAAFDVITQWGFTYKQTLVWHKTDVNLPGSVAPNSAEFILVGVKGSPPRGRLLPSAVVARTRHGSGGGGRSAPVKAHSQKPELFMDLIEAVSPAPYLEMFSRRARLGWDTYGDEALHGVELSDELVSQSYLTAQHGSAA